MSKELNIIEASNMPNTEFEVFYSECSKRNSNIFTNNCGDMYNKLDNSPIEGFNKIINAKFIPVQKPVDFMDLVKNSEGKKVYVEMNTDGYCDIKLPDESKCFIDYLYYIMRNNYPENVRKVILYGKWFIEE